jgi:hypothetical protein
VAALGTGSHITGAERLNAWMVQRTTRDSSATSSTTCSASAPAFSEREVLNIVYGDASEYIAPS